ncbi:hypothetical protein [Xanthobacter aminoxidans]|uniref:hypothetical protein n=1 Tax=Xanthobacter aminoxidans TaxID=186280 RepID=UPI0037271369
MIRLNLARGKRTLDLGHGVTVTVLPLTSAMMMMAKDRLAARKKVDGEEISTTDLVKALGLLSITAWEGVAGDDGSPAAVTEESVSALLDLYPIFNSFNDQFVGPALTLEAEKNASAPSPNGTSAGAKAIAKRARNRARSARMQ